MILKVFGHNGCIFALILAILYNPEQTIALKLSYFGDNPQCLTRRYQQKLVSCHNGTPVSYAFVESHPQFGLRSGRSGPLSSQKHILEKERYIRREGPTGFQKIDNNPKNLDKTKKFKEELESRIPTATAKDIWDHFNYTGGIRKGILSGKQYPSKFAKRPNYYKTGTPEYVPYPESKRTQDDPRGTIKTPEEIEGIRKACKIAREILDSVHDLIVEGAFTDDIDRKIHRMCHIKKVYPSPLNYHGFPKSVCVSVNEVMCHGK